MKRPSAQFYGHSEKGTREIYKATQWDMDSLPWERDRLEKKSKREGCREAGRMQG